MSESQKPSVGRIVHVFCRQLKDTSILGIGPYPAIVYLVHGDGMTISAQAFPRGYVEGVRGEPIPFSDKAGNEGIDLWWDWPERV